MGLLATLLRTTSNVFGGVYGYIGVAVVTAILVGSASGVVVHRIDLAKYEALELKDAKAATQVAVEQAKAEEEVAAKQHTIDTQATVEAVAEAQAQTKIVTKTVTITKEIPRIVTVQADRVSCIPNSVIRLLNAQIGDGLTPADASTLGTTPEQSDDACSSVVASDFTEQIIERIIKPAELNAEQLNALELSIIAEIKAANGT